MEWTDEGIVLGVRRHGESSAIVELLTRSHGRHLGLVRGGAGKRRARDRSSGVGCRSTSSVTSKLARPASGGLMATKANDPLDYYAVA